MTNDTAVHPQTYTTMNEAAKLKRKAREAHQERQAKRVVGGIIIALLLLAVLATIAHWAL